MKKGSNLEKLNHDLKDWTINFLKYKDAFYKRIQKIEDSKTPVILTYKDKIEFVFIVNEIDNGEISEIIKTIENDNNKSSFIISCFNTKNNLESIISNWQRLSGLSNLLIIFSNPDSKIEEKWLLKPFMHNRVIETDNLKQSLSTLFSNVDEMKI